MSVKYEGEPSKAKQGRKGFKLWLRLRKRTSIHTVKTGGKTKTQQSITLRFKVILNAQKVAVTNTLTFRYPSKK